MNQIQLDRDTISLIGVLVLGGTFLYYYVRDTYGGIKLPVRVKKEPLEEAAEVVDTTVIEGVIVEQKIEGEMEQLSTVFREIDMALMPMDTEPKQARWIRDQKAALQPKGEKRPVPYAVALTHLNDYQVYVGRHVILAQQKLLKEIATGESIGPATP